MLFVAIFFSLLLLSSSVFAQNWWDFPVNWEIYSIKNMVKVIIPGVRDEWLAFPDFIYFVVFPFVAAWAVIYGIMEEIHIFRTARFAHKVVSFVMAAMLLPSGWLLVIVNWLYMIDAWVALVTFGLVFLAGTIFWGYGTFVGVRSEHWDQGRYKSLHRGVRNEIIDTKTKIYQLKEEIAKNKNISKNSAEIDKLYEKLTELESKKKALEETPVV